MWRRAGSYERDYPGSTLFTVFEKDYPNSVYGGYLFVITQRAEENASPESFALQVENATLEVYSATHFTLGDISTQLGQLGGENALESAANICFKPYPDYIVGNVKAKVASKGGYFHALVFTAPYLDPSVNPQYAPTQVYKMGDFRNLEMEFENMVQSFRFT
ncbi:MAG: hypothetical protein AB1305_00060 [Candidatus Hadarchaeota archaeon]